MKYVGWIRANPEDLVILQELGVEGAMIYNEVERAFEYCEVSDERALCRLEQLFPGFWRGAFTAVDE